MNRHPLLPLPERKKVARFSVLHPSNDDVIVRQRRGNPHTVYLLGTPKTPDQFSVLTREDAVRKAVAFAMQQHVRAWVDNGDNTFSLLNTFRDDTCAQSRAARVIADRPGHSA